MSIPLINDVNKNDINTSIIAIKKDLERINTLLGLNNTEEIDTSIFATKEELEQAKTDLAPVDEVTIGNMHSVTSGAVAGALGTWEILLNVTGAVVMGLVQNGVKYLYFHFDGYKVTSSGDRLFTLPSNFRTTQEAQRFYFFYDYPSTKFSFGNILPNGQVLLYGAGNFGNTEIYGDFFLLLI